VPALVLSGDLLLRLLGQTAADGTVLVLGAVVLALMVALFWVRRRKADRKANDAAPASAAPRIGLEKTLD
jgi:LPXTG-motif cell wall-anchored protein